MKRFLEFNTIPILAPALALTLAIAAASPRADEMSWEHPQGISRGMTEAQLKECERRASLHGSAQGPVYLGNDCFEAIFELAPPNANRRSLDDETLTAGFRNALLSRTLRHDEFAQHIREPLYADAILAGSNTGLHRILAVSLDTINREIAVVEGSTGDILFFGAPYEGNVFPARAIHAAATDAVAIAVDAAASEVAVARKSGSIQFFARSSQAGTPARTISGSATQLVMPSGIAVAPNHREVFVSDSVGNQVLVFGEGSQGNVAPLRVIRGGATQIFQPQAVSYVPSADAIQVINGDGSIVNFKRDSSGSPKPL